MNLYSTISNNVSLYIRWHLLKNIKIHAKNIFKNVCVLKTRKENVFMKTIIIKPTDIEDTLKVEPPKCIPHLKDWIRCVLY